MRLVVYPIILLAVGGIVYGYSQFKIGTYSQACAANTHMQAQEGVLGRHKEVMACLYEEANFIERWILRPDQKMLAALPSSPCRYVGNWAAERSKLTSSINLTHDGRYTGSVVSGVDSGLRFSGVWGVHDNKMVWLDDSRMVWPLDINKIVDEGAKGFTLIERDGSRTRYALSELPASGECANALASENGGVEVSGSTEDTGKNLSASSSLTTPPVVDAGGKTDAPDDTQNVAAPVKTVLLADPLPLNSQETLFLHENIPYAEKVNWVNGKTEKIDLPFITRYPVRDKYKNLKRYALAVNKAGLWFAGPALALREPDGNIQITDFDYHESHIVALNDGSLLVFAKARTERTFEVFRARLTKDKQLTLHALDSAPELHSGFAAVTLNNGRVLVAAGQYTANEARIFNPKDNSWKATGNMHVRRSYMAMAALPDGRAVVVSSGSRAYAADDNDTIVKQIYGVEIWDPVTNSWSLLPSLPLSFRINAHHAIKPSMAVLPDGSLVVGGGMHRHVLLLRATGKTFARYWTVAGSLPGQRINGIVQALSNQEVVVSGGVGPVRKDGGCCKYQALGDRINWAGDGSYSSSSISLARRGAAVAHREGVSFAAGGWESFSLSSQTTQASSFAELINHQTGQVTTLPPLPKPMPVGQAIWLDAERVLVKSVAQGKTDPRGHAENIFRAHFGRTLEAEAGGYSAIYDKQQNS